MGNVVQLFKKLTPAAAKITIIANLKNTHHGKAVNGMCATRGVDDFSMAFNTLQTLIEENVVMIKRIPLKDKNGVTHHAPLYWYNFNSDYNG
jgi:hypothetical protein